MQKQLSGIESVGSTTVASGRDGVLLERAGTQDWRSLFLEGATGNGRGVFDVALTADRKRAWFCGASGTFGYYDRERGTVEPHVGPYDITSDFQSVSVRGESGSESVHAADDNGRIVRAGMDGESLTVEGVAIPGGGTAFAEIVDDGEFRYAADDDGNVFYTDDGTNWRRERLAETTIEGLAIANDGLAAVTDSGAVYRRISLPGDGRTERLQPVIDSPSEIAAAGGRIAVAGGNGTAVLDGDGTVSLETIGTDKELTDVELLNGRKIVAIGADGVVVEGTAA